MAVVGNAEVPLSRVTGAVKGNGVAVARSTEENAEAGVFRLKAD